MKTIFANSGRCIDYKGTKHKIVQSGIRLDDTPFVELNPENKELEARMCGAIRKKGTLEVRIGSPFKLVLGDDQYPYLR